MVCVVPGKLPAKVMVAPNSPSARENASSAPTLQESAAAPLDEAKVVIELVGSIDGQVEIRPLRSQADYRACVALQRETWGADFDEVVAPAILNVVQRIGGVAAGQNLVDKLRFFGGESERVPSMARRNSSRLLVNSFKSFT